MAKTKFPKTLYIKREEDGDESYLLTAENPGEHAEVGESVPVGVYELVKTANITAEVTVK